MKTKCPCCGAINSLDALVANEKAREAIALALQFNGELGKVLIGYLGLFRPASSSLSFDRVATLLGQLLPSIQAAEIQRDRHTFPAPTEAWIYAINTMVANRENLKLPMTSHGYLFEIISSWKPELSPSSAVKNPQNSTALANGFSMLVLLKLKNAPREDEIAPMLETWYRVLTYKRQFERELDEKRFHEAFVRLAQRCEWFPTPKELFDALPKREIPDRPQIEYHVDPQVAAENIKKLKAILKGAHHNVRRNKT